MQTQRPPQEHTAVPLALLFKDLGYGATYSSPVVLAVLEQAGALAAMGAAQIADADAAALLAMMASSHTGLPSDSPALRSLVAGALSDPELDQLRKMSSWNIELLFPLLMKLNPAINWTAVLRGLDIPDVSFADPGSFALILKASKAVLQDIYSFPISAFLDRWANARAQLNFIRHILQHTPELFSVSRTLPRRVVSPEMVPPGTVGRSILTSASASPWNSLELIQCLMQLCETPFADDARALIDVGVQHSPDLILLAFSQLLAPWSSIIKEYGPSLVALFLAGHPHSPYVLPRVWQYSPGLFVSGLVLTHSKNPSSLPRILDMAQEMKALTQILETKPLSFSIDLAALASRREYLNLEKWLQEHIREEGTVFVSACLEFIGTKMTQQLSRGTDVALSIPGVPLSVDVARIFLRVLHGVGANMTPDQTALFKELLSICSQAYPQLTGNSDDAPLYPEGSGFPPDIDQEANTYYAKLYKNELSIGQFLDMLQRLKSSTNPRDQEVFRCTIQSLFGEFEFFKEYPERELTITSMLFGLLIQNQIVSSTDLGMSLRFVLDTLRQPVGSKLFNFGIQALKQFQGRLCEWPQYSALLMQIEHLRGAHPEIIQLIKGSQDQVPLQAHASNGGMSSKDIDAAASGMGVVSNVVSVGTKDANPVESQQEPSTDSNKTEIVFTAVGIQSPPNNIPSETPPESVQDKILFIVNNVSEANLESKVGEMSELLKPPYYDWFGHYLVVKRVSIELNFHGVYISLLDALKSGDLYKHILHETLLNIHMLLNSEKTLTSSQERSLLKNLGTWLGGISLAKNKPILHKHLSMKELLLQGFNSGRLIVVIPFVCKVLEQVSSSVVFRPPNPWLMAIMRFLVELYHFAELKLNLKFEIEVLCKNIKLDISDILPTDILRERISRETISLTQAPNTISQIVSAETSEETSVGYPSLASYITFNPNISLFATQPSLKRIVHIAIDRSIREVILSPVVERSVTIAVVATRELVVKDYALEPNEERLRKAAHWMVQSLAGSLAAVSSREPLRVSMMSNLRSLLLQNGFTEQTVPEQAVHVIVSDNLELACSVMEKAAAEKAAPEMDESLSVAYMSRRKHRERTNQPYYDINVYSSSRYPANLPESLRLRVGGPSMSQLRLYEDFLRVPHPMERNAKIQNLQSAQIAYSNPSVSNQEEVVSPQQILDRFNTLVEELDRVLKENPDLNANNLPERHEIRILSAQILQLVAPTTTSDEMTLLFAQKILQLLYKNPPTALSLAVYISLLRHLCDKSVSVLQELKEWFLYVDDDRKYNVVVVSSLLENELLSIPEFEMQLARQIDTMRPGIVSFAVSLLRNWMTEKRNGFPTDFLFTIQALRQISKRESDFSVDELLQEIDSSSAVLVVQEIVSRDVDANTLREQLGLVFQEWVHIFYHPSSTTEMHFQFVKLLQKMLRSEVVSPLFFRVCVELSVESYRVRSAGENAPSRVYQAVDAFSHLLVLLIVEFEDPHASDQDYARINLTARALSILVLVLAHAHEQQKETFDQRPFFRIFSSFLNNLKLYEENVSAIHIQILSAVSNTLHTIQPSFLPGFTFAWLQLISHRQFMPRLLLSENQKCWPYFQRLLVDLFKFLNPLLRQGELTESIRMLYRGTLRILLVLLHDFPEFLCDYHFSLVDAIPPSCIQLRNLILSAFPRNMRLPDPFTPNLKIDLLPEVSQSPRILSDYTTSLMRNNFKQDVDTYLRTRGPVSFLMDLQSRLVVSCENEEGPAAPDGSYNIPMINALVLYVGVQAIAQTQSAPAQNSGWPIATHNAAMDVFQQLVVDMDAHGRYLFLCAIANQLRYPNAHTHYFSSVLLFLFSEAAHALVQEQITRVLIERLIVNRPHPYGLLITFIELIRNPRYCFWDHSAFIRGAPEIERLFQNVAKSINNSMSRIQQQQ